MNSSWTGRAPRSMRQAFNPYADNTLHPMRSAKTSNAEIYWYIAGLIVVLLFINVVAR